MITCEKGHERVEGKFCKICKSIYKLDWQRKHRQTPEGKEKCRIYAQRYKEYKKAFYRTEEAKARARAYFQREEVVKKRKSKERKLYLKAYLQRPEVKLKLKLRRQKQEVQKQTREYRQKNISKIKEYKKNYRKECSHKVNALSSKRRAAQLKRTPPWLTKEDFEKIEFFYKEAKRLERIDGIRRHVDHIIPLQGKDVSGLHVPSNLQILTATQNISKGNRLKK